LESFRSSRSRFSAAADGEATRVRNKKEETRINNLIVLESFRSSRSRFSAAADGEATRVRNKKEETRINNLIAMVSLVLSRVRNRTLIFMIGYDF
jgi:hypothetical protein